jgi:ferredoxin
MRIVVDYSSCESNGLCVLAAADVFDLRDDDNLYLLDEDPPENRRADVEAAVRACPKQAIQIDDPPK